MPLPDLIKDYVSRIVDAAPPLTTEQRDHLGALFAPIVRRPAAERRRAA